MFKVNNKDIRTTSLARYNKAAKKLNALQRIANLIDCRKRNHLFQSITKSQLAIAYLTGCFTLEDLINSVYKRALKVIYIFEKG